MVFTWVVTKLFLIPDTSDFGGFDRFPFDDIPPEFREHFPSHWNRRFGSREEQFQPPQSPQPHSPQQQTAATQTEENEGNDEQTPLPQYGLRNTVDLGQKSPADPSVEADERSHRSMSAPPDHCTVTPNTPKMSGPNQEQPHHEQPSNVRHIPIFVEGRDEPVINKNVDHGTHFADPKPTYVPPPQPHIDREQYFADDGPGSFSFAKGFDRPFFRQGPQPFTKQKMYPQAAAFNRGASPQRSQSPKPQYHEPPRPETPSRQQQKQPSPQQRQPPAPPQQPPQPQQKQQQQQHYQQQEQQQHQSQQNQAPPPPPQPSANDPITLILSIQTDVLNLMTDVENFTGAKNDKRYLYLDEMLTRNLIKLDNIETEGKENIRQARKEAIKCIQKCIAVLEAKAESNKANAAQPQDVEMQNENAKQAAEQNSVQNGDVEMKETKEDKVESQPEVQAQEPPAPAQSGEVKEKPDEVKKDEPKPQEKEPENPEVADTRPEEPKTSEQSELKPEEKSEKKQSPKKVVKKRDKSKDKKDVANENKKEEVEKQEETKKEDEKKDLDKTITNENVNKDDVTDKKDKVDNKEKIEDVMQTDASAKGNVMEVDGAASQ